MQERFKVSVHRSCRLALLQRSTSYAKSEPRDKSAQRQCIRDIALSRPRFGYLRVLVMLKREGWQVGKKRVYRLYWLEGLQMLMKVKRRIRIALLRGKPQKPTRPNQHWSMDFVTGIKLDYTCPGKPTDNGLIESCNGRLRDEFLNVNELITLHDAREKMKAWQNDYKHHRSHGSLGNLTQSELVNSRSVQPIEAASL